MGQPLWGEIMYLLKPLPIVAQEGALLWALEPSHFAQRLVRLPGPLAAAAATAVACLAEGKTFFGSATGEIWSLQVRS